MKKIICIALLLGMLLTLCSCVAEEEKPKIEKIKIISDHEYSVLQKEVNDWLWNNQDNEVIEIEFEFVITGSYVHSYNYVAMIHYVMSEKE